MISGAPQPLSLDRYWVWPLALILSMVTELATRRNFLTGLMATGLAPAPSWADAGSPAYLAAARLPSGAYALFGLDMRGTQVFRIDLPDRGHAAAAHPSLPIAVAFARRPGTFALVIDCATGRENARLIAPPGYHFAGHGAFSGDGSRLFTSENDYENARGMVGIWDVRSGYQRLGAFPSGGVGPHELRIMPDGETLVLANGGIETHPETGRAKLNIPEMRPNLSYVAIDGRLLDSHEPPREWQKASTRHLSVRPDGLVALACQWEGPLSDVPPLLATHWQGEALRFHGGNDRLEQRMQGYAGSISFSGDGREIAITGPRGGLAAVFGADGAPLHELHSKDVCGVAPAGGGLLFTTGQGHMFASNCTVNAHLQSHDMQWDNHLIHIA
ncbi:MAG: DUF1513 domain-containing protein [Pseudomonadota bacterium]